MEVGSTPEYSGAAGEVLGTVADPSDADRKIVVVARDAPRFEPSTIEVEAGEVITFEVRNEGGEEHEFVLGDAAYQETHQAEMTDMAGDSHHMSDLESGVSVPPGERKELTWAFPEAGQVLFGCHEPGHYEGGMVGTITVS